MPLPRAKPNLRRLAERLTPAARAGELVALPSLDAVGEPEAVHAFVSFDHVGSEPSSFGTIRTAADDTAERFVDGTAELVLAEHAGQAA